MSDRDRALAKRRKARKLLGEAEAELKLYGDTHERLRAANQAAGWPELTAEDLQHIDHGAELLSDVLVADLGEGWPNGTEDRWLAKGLSVEAINAWNGYRHQRASLGDIAYKSLGPMQTTHSDQVWRSRRSIADLHNAFRQPKTLCIVAAFPKKAYPLDRLEDWSLIYPRGFINYSGCDVRISTKCQDTMACTTVSLKHGEFVTVHKVCDACFRWPYANSHEAVARFRGALTEHHVERLAQARFEELLRISSRGVV